VIVRSIDKENLASGGALERKPLSPEAVPLLLSQEWKLRVELFRDEKWVTAGATGCNIMISHRTQECLSG
jgi:hypothetical protein